MIRDTPISPRSKRWVRVTAMAVKAHRRPTRAAGSPSPPNTTTVSSSELATALAMRTHCGRHGATVTGAPSGPQPRFMVHPHAIRKVPVGRCGERRVDGASSPVRPTFAPPVIGDPTGTEVVVESPRRAAADREPAGAPDPKAGLIAGRTQWLYLRSATYERAIRTGESALRGVDIVVEKREIVALLGLSGSGKSTLPALHQPAGRPRLGAGGAGRGRDHGARQA